MLLEVFVRINGNCRCKHDKGEALKKVNLNLGFNTKELHAVKKALWHLSRQRSSSYTFEGTCSKLNRRDLFSGMNEGPVITITGTWYGSCVESASQQDD